METNIKHVKYNETPQQILERALTQCSLDSKLNGSAESAARYDLILTLAYQLLDAKDFFKCFVASLKFDTNFDTDEAEDFLLAAFKREAKVFEAAKITLTDLKNAVQSAKMWGDVEKQLDDMANNDSKS